MRVTVRTMAAKQAQSDAHRIRKIAAVYIRFEAVV